MEAVRALNIGKTFGRGETEVRALVDVSFALEAGRLAALLGPSGAGKSTLIKALGLVSLPDTGSVLFEGRPVVVEGVAVADVSELRRRHLGFVFQKANLVSFLTARENVEVACEIGEVERPRERAAELLRYLEVEHRADAYPETLSGGEQQRVAIARALANRPSLILADEPTAALDKSRGRAVMELFRRVAHEQGAAVLVVTHDHRALDLFDVTHEMEDGRILDRPGVAG
ncbi:MAG: ABC transporter ATP-binding protein [Polyangiales bacterium]